MKMNYIDTRRNQFIVPTGPAARLSWPVRWARKSLNLPGHQGLLTWASLMGSGLIAEVYLAALSVPPQDRLVTADHHVGRGVDSVDRRLPLGRALSIRQ
jgi:hypothetical protein